MRGRRHAACLRGRRARGDRRLRSRQVEVPLRPGPGARPLAQPAGRRPLRVRRGAGPGRPRRAGASQRHPRPRALAPLDAPDPAPEPALPPPAAASPTRLPVLAPARARVPRGPGRTDRDHTPSRSTRGRSPSAWASTPISRPGPDEIDGAILHVPARHTLDLNDRGLPTGALTPVEGSDRDFERSRFVGPAVLDTAYTSLERDADGKARASLDAPGGVTGAPRSGWTRAFPT